jgi:hypothetical protein
MVIAGALTVFDRPEWNLLFYYVVAMGALRLPRPWNVVVLPVTSLTAGLTATAGGGNTSAAWGQALGLLGIGAAMVAMGEIMRTNRELVEARAGGGAPGRWPTSASASRATCTTCSATRCRSSR